jgi:hypothetical protein
MTFIHCYIRKSIHSNGSITLAHTSRLHIYMAQFPLLPLLPLLAPLCLPLVSPSTYLAPSSCDRNRPPPSKVACKLTPFAPPHPVDPPPQLPRTPHAPRLTTTTSGIFWLLVSRTNISCLLSKPEVKG